MMHLLQQSICPVRFSETVATESDTRRESHSAKYDTHVQS